MALTEQQLVWAVLGGMAVIVVGAITIFWVSRKYPPTRKTKAVPLYWAFVIWILLLLGYGLIFLFGWRSQADAKADVKWLVISLVVLIVFFAVASYFTARPIPSDRLWKEFVLPDVKRQWGGEPYVGAGYFSGLILSMVIEPRKHEFMRSMIGQQGMSVPEKVEVFYGNSFFGNVFPFMSVRNKYTGERNLLVRPPILTTSLIQRFLGEELVSSFTPELSKYAEQEENISQPREIAVQR